MPVTQQTHWKTTGTEPTAGVDDEYVVNGQPIAEHDNWIIYYLVDDITNALDALQNVTTGHDHDGVNSKTIDSTDVINAPFGDIVATDVQAALEEMHSERSRIYNGSYTGNDTTNRAIPHGLGTTPKMVSLVVGGVSSGVFRVIQPGNIHFTYSGGDTIYSITSWDATNFYVGNATQYERSGNGSGATYYWVAFS